MTERYNALVHGYGSHLLIPQLKAKYQIISCFPVSKETLPKIRVSKLMPDGHGKCVKCGIEATHVFTYTFKSDPGVVYSNIFAGARMMTADHILPRALGGRDWLPNLQLMCSTCNHKKGCIPTLEEFELIKQNREQYLRMNLTKGQVKNILNICPGVSCLFNDYFEDGPVSVTEIPRPIKQTKHGFKRSSGRPMKIKHPHHPLRGWIRIFEKFPNLKQHVHFYSPHSIYG